MYIHSNPLNGDYNLHSALIVHPACLPLALIVRLSHSLPTGPIESCSLLLLLLLTIDIMNVVNARSNLKTIILPCCPTNILHSFQPARSTAQEKVTILFVGLSILCRRLGVFHLPLSLLSQSVSQ